MENYTTYEITGFQNLKNLIKELNNDSTIIMSVNPEVTLMILIYTLYK